MAIEHHFYLDATATRHELRDALVQAVAGFWAEPDFKDLSIARSEATDVTVLGDLSYTRFRPDNGVMATRYVTFRDRNLHMRRPEAGDAFEEQTVQGVVALLKAFPDAAAYWEAYDARRPVLLRRCDQLVLSQEQAEPGRFWEAGPASFLALMDLPYVVEPLGPWPTIPVEATERERLVRLADG